MDALLRKPVSLSEAAAVLAERYPEYAFSARKLREMCDAKTVRCLLRPCKSKSRCMYYVRVGELLNAFNSWER